MRYFKIRYSLQSLWLFCLTTTALMGVYFLSNPWEKVAQIQLPEQECRYFGNVLLSEQKDKLIFTTQGNIVYGINLDNFNVAWKIKSAGIIGNLFYSDNKRLVYGTLHNNTLIFRLIKTNVGDGIEKSLFSTHTPEIIRSCEKNILTLNLDNEIALVNYGNETVRKINMFGKNGEPHVRDVLPGKEFGRFLVYAGDYIFIYNFDNASKFKIDVPEARLKERLIHWDEEKDQVLLANGHNLASIYKIDIKSGKRERLFLNTAFCCVGSIPVTFGNNYTVMWTQSHMYILNTKTHKKSQIFYNHLIRQHIRQAYASSSSVDVNEECDYFAYINNNDRVLLYDLNSYDVLWEHAYPAVRLVKCIDKETLVLGMEDGSIQKWKRRYPPGWLGHFYRPEIWFAVLFIALSICAIIRKVIDGRNLSSTAKVDG